MVFDTPGIGHAAGADDHAGLAHIVQQLGVGGFFDIFQTLELKGVAIALQEFLHPSIEICWILFDHLGKRDAEGAIQIVGKRGQSAFQFQLIQVIEDFLCTTQAESRKDELTFFLDAGMVNPVKQLVGRLLGGLMQGIAVGRFHDDVIGLWEGSRGSQDHIAVTAHITGKSQVEGLSVFLYPEMYTGAAQDMACVGKQEFYTIGDGRPPVVRDFPEQLQAGGYIGRGVKRFNFRLGGCRRFSFLRAKSCSSS